MLCVIDLNKCCVISYEGGEVKDEATRSKFAAPRSLCLSSGKIQHFDARAQCSPSVAPKFEILSSSKRTN